VATNTAYLQGGPCAGRLHTITAAESDTGEIVCNGGLYKNAELKNRRRGGIVFKYAGAAASAGTTAGKGSGAYAPNVTRAWSHIEKSVNRRLPTAQHRIDYAMRRTLQHLSHKRRVR
jgi:hypothetical protein